MLLNHEWFPTGGNQPLDRQRIPSSFLPTACSMIHVMAMGSGASATNLLCTKQLDRNNSYKSIWHGGSKKPSDYFKPTMTSCLHSFETLCYLFPFWDEPNNLPDTIGVKWLKEQALLVSQSLEGKTQSWNSVLKGAIHKTPEQNKWKASNIPCFVYLCRTTWAGTMWTHRHVYTVQRAKKQSKTQDLVLQSENGKHREHWIWKHVATSRSPDAMIQPGGEGPWRPKRPAPQLGYSPTQHTSTHTGNLHCDPYTVYLQMYVEVVSDGKATKHEAKNNVYTLYKLYMGLWQNHNLAFSSITSLPV